MSCMLQKYGALNSNIRQYGKMWSMCEIMRQERMHVHESTTDSTENKDKRQEHFHCKEHQAPGVHNDKG